MRIRSPKDFWAGLIFIAIGGGFILLAQQYRLGDLHRMGPAHVPDAGRRAAGRARRGHRAARVRCSTASRCRASTRGRSASRSLAIVLFGIALQWLGLVAAVAVLVLVGAYASRDVRPLENARARRGHDRCSRSAVFVWLLGLPLPLWPDS